MIVFDLFGFDIYHGISPIVAIVYTIGLLVLLITVSKLFFWMLIDKKSPVKQKPIAKQLYTTPDILMQNKSLSPEIQEINNLEPNLQNSKSIGLRFVAVTIAVVFCVIKGVYFLYPVKDLFY